MPNASDFQPNVANPTATIANGSSISGAIDLGGTTLCGIHMPAAFTGTSLTFTASPTFGGTYQTVQSAGADYSVPCAAGKYVGVSLTALAGLQYIKVVSNGVEAAARSLILATRPV